MDGSLFLFINSITFFLPQLYSKYTKIFIYGKLEAESLSTAVLKDGNYTEVYYIFPSDQAYLMITLNNKTGYEIKSVTISNNEYTELTKIDNEHYVLTMPESRGTRPNYKLTQIKYLQGSTEATITPSSVSCRAVKLSSEEIKYISTPEDLLSMNGNKYYELTNDIDLAGIEWHGNDFVGVFNGNGHSINNMSFVGTITDQTAQLGLFTSSSGVIQDLHMKGIRFIVNLQSTAVQDYRIVGGISSGIACGGIVAGSGGTSFINCSVDKNSYISISGDGVNEWDGGVGGIVGTSSDYNSWINCQNYATISSNVGAVGGIVGYGSGLNIVNGGKGDIFENCANYGSVTGTDFVGGIAGYYNAKSFVNCFNAGTVTDTYADNYSTFAGGIVGIGGRNTILENCVNVGTVMAHGWNQCIFGNVETGTNDTTDFSWMDNFVNCHAIGDNESVEMLNSKSFYTDTLGWSEDIWNLDDLDIENGKYPTLK